MDNYESTECIFDLTIININDAPVCNNPIADQSIDEDALFEFTFDENIFSDADNDVLVYYSELSNGSKLPYWLDFSNTTRTYSGTAENNDVGTLDIYLYALDNNGDTAMCEFELTIVNTNDTPFVDNIISNQVTYIDSIWEFTFAENIFADVDLEDALTYSANLVGGEDLPDWLTFEPTTRTFSGTPINNDVETISISLNALDNFDATATCIFDLAITNINDAPVCNNPIENKSIDEDAIFDFTFDENVFSDADNDVLVYYSKLSDDSNLPYW